MMEIGKKRMKIEKSFLDLAIIDDLFLNILFRDNLHIVKCTNLMKLDEF